MNTYYLSMLAASDAEVVKIIVGVIAVIVWAVGSLIAALNNKAKKEKVRRQQMGRIPGQAAPTYTPPPYIPPGQSAPTAYQPPQYQPPQYQAPQYQPQQYEQPAPQKRTPTYNPPAYAGKPLGQRTVSKTEPSLLKKSKSKKKKGAQASVPISQPRQPNYAQPTYQQAPEPVAIKGDLNTAPAIQTARRGTSQGVAPARIGRLLRQPASLRAALILQEIVGKPLALRDSSPAPRSPSVESQNQPPAA